MGDRLAILVPVTSRGAGGAVDCVLKGLSKLASSMAADIYNEGSNSHDGFAVGARTEHTDNSSRVDSRGLERDLLVNRGVALANHPLIVILGIDADDASLCCHQQECIDQFLNMGVPTVVTVLSDHAPGAVCHIWSRMVGVAVYRYGCNLAVLLGDDTEVSPPGWPHKVLTAFQQQPDLMLLLLNDMSDPGFPSFPVVRVDRHLEVFKELLPACFINQGGDPYLAALYRRWQGCAEMLADVLVHNRVGGVQRLEQPYTAPRYTRHIIQKGTMLQELVRGTGTLEAWHSAAHNPGLIMNSSESVARTRGTRAKHNMQHDQVTCSQIVDASDQADKLSKHSSSNPGAADTATASLVAAVSGADDRPPPSACSRKQLTLDVLIPSYRVDLRYLKGIADAVLGGPPIPGCDLHLIIVVDQPATNIPAKAKAWLQQLQHTHPNKVRVRFHEHNLGASASRNTALQESLAEYVIFWDDDITPTPGCIAAYVQAIEQHPQALGFVGPSYVARDPGSVWACAVHQADVLFFWDAAKDWKVAEVIPWAVTANVALVNTAATFDLRFPKTGGGEDIDYCLKVTGGRLIPVPQAVVQHPLWSSGQRCYNRFFGWAYGDGALLAMYPQLCYYNWPSSAEAICMLLLLALAAVTLAVGVATATAVLQAPTAAGSVLQCCKMAVMRSCVCLTAAVGYKAVDLLLDVLRAFHPVRLSKHPCNTSLIRLAAAAEASFIKTWSEAGRLWGFACRKELFSTTTWQLPLAHSSRTISTFSWPRLCQRFDWFCCLCPGIVVAERHRGFWRFAACCAGAWASAVTAMVAAGLQVPLKQPGASSTGGKLYVEHSFATCAAVVAGCGLMLWKLEG